MLPVLSSKVLTSSSVESLKGLKLPQKKQFSCIADIPNVAVRSSPEMSLLFSDSLHGMASNCSNGDLWLLRGLTRSEANHLRFASPQLATLALQDWIDIDFAISEKVDFIAVSFVKGPDVINNLKSYLASRAGSSIEVIAKVESYDSVPNVPQIVEASDAVMVARGDLGASSSLGKNITSTSI